MSDPLDESLGRALAPAKPPDEVAAKIRAAIGKEMKPVKPLAPAGVRALVAAASGLAVAIAVAWAAGMRPLDPMPAGRPIAMLAMLAAATLGLWLAMRLAVPGSATPRRAAALYLLVPAVFAAIVLAVLGFHGEEGPFRCMLFGLAVAAVPWTIAIVLLARGYATTPVLAGAIAGMSAGLFGLMALHLSCPMATAPHILLFHASVVVIASALGAALALLL